jgi:hypothetical protein
MESAAVHDTHQYEHLERATAKHRRVYGDRAPQPSEVVVDHPHFGGQQHYVVLANGRGIVAVYRLRQGALQQMLRWPKALTLAHQERVWQHA